MSIKEQLESFRAAQDGIQHLVFGDLSSRMVLYAASATPRGQEDHDRLVAMASRVLGKDPVIAFGGAHADQPQSPVLVRDENGTIVFVPAGADASEILVLRLANSADAVAICAGSMDLLSGMMDGDDQANV